MAFLTDGGFTGFLYSMKETGRRLANGAKQVVEDFVSGFNGHGWKIWKSGDSWKMEIDELIVRKSLKAFELIISQVRAIKGSQAITQGNAKIKSVTTAMSDVYKESVTPIYTEDFTSSRWGIQQVSSENKIVVFAHYASMNKASQEIAAVYTNITDNIASFNFKASNVSGTIQMLFIKDNSLKDIQITTDGEYTFPEHIGIPNWTNYPPGFYFLPNSTGTIEMLPNSIEYNETIENNVPCFRIEIEEELNSLTEYDFIRCQKGDKFYHAQIGSVFQYYINIPISEFSTDPETGAILNPPMPGDEIVQFGNASHQEKYANRHSAIYMHLDGDEPAIDLMTDIYSKDWSQGNIIKTRLGGNLPGTNGDRGFYCVNGKILSVDENGETVYVINPDGSASFARGKLSWTKNGSPSFSGTILVQTDTNNVWQVNSLCENIIGNPDGARIVISPYTKDIRIYDESNKNVVSLDSRKLNNMEDVFGHNSVNIKIIEIPIEILANRTENKIRIDVTQRFYVKNPISLNIVSNYYYLRSINDFFNYKLELRRYPDDTSINPIESTPIVQYLPSRSIEDNISSTVNYTITAEGYYIISFYAEREDKKIWFKLNSLIINQVSDKYLSSFSSNGIALGTTTDNNFVVFNDSSNFINMNITNSNVGIRMDSGQIKIKENNLWGILPCIICYGRCNNGDLQRFVCYDRLSPPLTEKVDTGIYKIKFNSLWGVNRLSVFIQVTGIGRDYASTTPYNHNVKASVYAIYDTYALIALSDDASPNNGDFFFEIRRYLA